MCTLGLVRIICLAGSGKKLCPLVLLSVVAVYLTLTDPLRMQPWSQDRRDQNQIKPGIRSDRKNEKVLDGGQNADRGCSEGLDAFKVFL